MKLSHLRTINNVLFFSDARSDWKSDFTASKGFDLFLDKNGVTIVDSSSQDKVKTTVPLANVAFFITA
jgi:hypothetical protein